MDILKEFEGLTGIVNMVLILGIVPVVKMSHEVTSIRTKLELWEDTLKNCKGRRSTDKDNCQG